MSYSQNRHSHRPARLSFVSVIAIALLHGCATQMGRMPQAGGMEAVPSPSLGPFDKIWSAHTVLLRQESEGGGAPFLPFGGGESEGPRVEPFPLVARATYMDSTLIDAGIRQFSDLASMTQAEVDSFQARYRSMHCPQDSLFIWLTLSTTSTPEFLLLNRWTIFIENDEGRDFEPGRIVEHPVRNGSPRQALGGSEDVDRVRDEGRLIWSPVSKDVELYFPLHHFGNALIGSGTHSLKCVILDSRNVRVRAEAEWNLPLSAGR